MLANLALGLGLFRHVAHFVRLDHGKSIGPPFRAGGVADRLTRAELLQHGLLCPRQGFTPFGDVIPRGVRPPEQRRTLRPVRACRRACPPNLVREVDTSGPFSGCLIALTIVLRSGLEKGCRESDAGLANGLGAYMDTALLRLEEVERAYDDGIVIAVRAVNLSIFADERVAIVGHSGSGKSSLLNMMGGCDMPTSGRVYWRGHQIRDLTGWTRLRGVEIGMVFQDFLLLPTLTAAENVEMALMGRGIRSGERRRRAAALIDEVGLGARLNHLPHALSGGERQRVAIARSIANKPALLLADEPTGNLDSANAQVVLDLLLELQRSHRTSLVLVTHDEGLASRCARLIRMKDGRIEDAVSTPGNAGGAR